MAQIKVSVKNDSTVLTDAQVSAAVPALQKQVSLDFAQPWGVDADLDFVPKDQQPPPGHWWLIVSDDSDQAGALWAITTLLRKAYLWVRSSRGRTYNSGLNGPLPPATSFSKCWAIPLST